MPQVSVPLPQGIGAVEDFPRATEDLVNVINLGNNQIVTRPGVLPNRTNSGYVRGAAYYKNRLFQASGGNLLFIPSEIEADPIALGSLPSTSEVIFAKGHTEMVILETGAGFYSWSDTGGSGTFKELESPNYIRSVDVAFMDGRWYYCPFDGGPIFYSEVGQPDNIGPTNFFDAELAPDNNRGLINYRNTLYVFGEDTIERFRTIGSADPNATPVNRVQGGQIDNGYLSGRILYGPSFAFIGREQGGHVQIFMADEGSAVAISNANIEDVLNQTLSEEEILGVQAQRFVWRSQDILVYTFANRLEAGAGSGLTIAFNGVGWSRFTSGPVEDYVLWLPNYITWAYDAYYCGDVYNDRVGILDLVNAEYGLQIERQIDTFVRVDPDSFMTPRALELAVKTGTNPNEPITLPNRHIASQFQVARDASFRSIVFDSSPVGAITEQIVAPPLEQETDYYWRTRYSGDSGISDFSTPTIFKTRVEEVVVPTNVAPADTAIDQGLTPTLTSSVFNVLGPVQVHIQSNWQLATDVNFTTIIEESLLDGVNLESYAVQTTLLATTQYFWRVSHVGNVTGDSGYSTPTSFTTIGVGVLPPVNSLPINGQINVLVDNTILAAGAFGVTGPAQTHDASQWQISDDVGFSNIVFDSGTDAVNLLTITSNVVLTGSTRYWFRVRYEGNTTGFSSYSTPTFFNTEAVGVDRPDITSPDRDQINFPIAGPLLGGPFSVVGPAQTHIGSQWEVSTDLAGDNVVADSGTVIAPFLTSWPISPVLTNEQTYFCRVRYQGDLSGFSGWSGRIAFTAAPSATVVIPSGVFPINGSTGQDTDTLLFSTPFEFFGAAQTHTSSNWQLATDEAFTNIVFESLLDATNLTSIEVTPDLQGNLTYYWRVAHTGSVSGLTAYSIPFSFRTGTGAVGDWANWDGTQDGADLSFGDATTGFNKGAGANFNRQNGTFIECRRGPGNTLHARLYTVNTTTEAITGLAAEIDLGQSVASGNGPLSVEYMRDDLITVTWAGTASQRVATIRDEAGVLTLGPVFTVPNSFFNSIGYSTNIIRAVSETKLVMAYIGTGSVLQMGILALAGNDVSMPVRENVGTLTFIDTFTAISLAWDRVNSVACITCTGGIAINGRTAIYTPAVDIVTNVITPSGQVNLSTGRAGTPRSFNASAVWLGGLTSRFAILSLVDGTNANGSSIDLYIYEANVAIPALGPTARGTLNIQGETFFTDTQNYMKLLDVDEDLIMLSWVTYGVVGGGFPTDNSRTYDTSANTFVVRQSNPNNNTSIVSPDLWIDTFLYDPSRIIFARPMEVPAELGMYVFKANTELPFVPDKFVGTGVTSLVGTGNYSSGGNPRILLSMWVQFDDDPGTLETLASTASFRLGRNAAGNIFFNTSPIFDNETVAVFGRGYYHIYVRQNTATVGVIVVNRVTQELQLPWAGANVAHASVLTLLNSTPALTPANASLVSDLAVLTGAAAQINIATPDKFIDELGHPVDNGADGSGIGVAAATLRVYMNGFYQTLANWNAGVNAGTAADFTVTGVFTLDPSYDVPNAVSMGNSTWISGTQAFGSASETVLTVATWFNSLQNGSVSLGTYGSNEGRISVNRGNQVNGNSPLFISIRNGGTFESFSTENVVPQTDLNHVLVNYTDGVCIAFVNGDEAPVLRNAFVINEYDALGTFSLFSTGSGDQALRANILYDFWASHQSIPDIPALVGRFINLAGVQENLGVNGERVTGIIPEVFLGGTMVAADWNAGVNRGTLSGLTAVGVFTDVTENFNVILAEQEIEASRVDDDDIGTPTNVSPFNGQGNVGLTPTLIGSEFESGGDLIIPQEWRVGFSISQDGTVWGQVFYRPFQPEGRYADRMQWRYPGGLGRYENFMGIRISTAAPLEFSTDSLWLDVP